MTAAGGQEDSPGVAHSQQHGLAHADRTEAVSIQVGTVAFCVWCPSTTWRAWPLRFPK
jgi:hypothetical protein